MGVNPFEPECMEHFGRATNLATIPAVLFHGTCSEHLYIWVDVNVITDLVQYKANFDTY